MPGPIVAKGSSVSLRIVTKDDLTVIWESMNDPEVKKFLRYPFEMYYYEDELEWYENLRKDKRRNRAFLIEGNASSEIVGIASLHDIDQMSRHAEIGCVIYKPYWKQGFATQAALLLLDYARNVMNLRKVYAFADGPNEASRHVLEKIGFVECGRLREQEYIPGEGFVDLIFYEKFFVD